MNEYHNSVKLLVKGTGITIFGMFISKLITYFYRLFIARYFGPADYGLFSIALGVMSFSTTIALLGTKSGIMRYVSFYVSKRDYGRAKGALLSALRITVPFSVFFTVALFIASDFLAASVFSKPELGPIIRILSFSLPFSTVFYISMLALLGIKKIKYNVLCEYIVNNASKLIFTIAFGLMGMGLLGIVWGWFLGLLTAFLLSTYFVITHFLTGKFSVKTVYIDKQLMTYSLPLLFSGFVALLMTWTDTLMLGIFRTSGEVGIYNAALPTAQILMAFPMAVSALLFSISTGLYAKKLMDEVKKLYTVVTRWFFFVNTPVLILMLFFSRQILRVLFGAEYMEGYLALSILSFGFFIRFVFPMSNMLIMMGKTKQIMYIDLAAAAGNIILNYILIPVFGIVGAATATAATQFFIISALIIFSHLSIKFVPKSLSIAKYVAASLISMLVVYSVARMFFGEISSFLMLLILAVFILLYMLSVLLFKGFERDDVELIKMIEKKTGIKMRFMRNVIKRFID